jgi:hypothetical protein
MYGNTLMKSRRFLTSFKIGIMMIFIRISAAVRPEGTSSHGLEGVGVISIIDRSDGLLRWHVCRRDIAYRSSPILSALGVLYDCQSEDVWTREA